MLAQQGVSHFAQAVQQLRTASPSGTTEALEDCEAVLLLQTTKTKHTFLKGKEYTHSGVLLKRLHNDRCWSAPVPVHVSNAAKRKLGNGEIAIMFLQEGLLSSFQEGGKIFIDPENPEAAKGFFNSGAPTTLSGCLIEIDDMYSHSLSILPSFSLSKLKRMSSSLSTNSSSGSSAAECDNESPNISKTHMQSDVASISILRDELELLFKSYAIVQP